MQFLSQVAVEAGEGEFEMEMSRSVLWLLAYVILVNCGDCLASEAGDAKPVGHALGWFGYWYAPKELEKTQRCEGDYRNRRVWMFCSPMRAQVWILVGPDGECVINGIGQESGVPNIFTIEEGNRAGAVIRGSPHACDSIPQIEGSFKVEVKPELGRPDLELSSVSRTRALRYLSQGRPDTDNCVAYFPIVYVGDPIFRVYVKCDGVLRAIDEYDVVPPDRYDYGPRSSISFWKNRPTVQQIAHLSNRRLWLSASSIGDGPRK